MTSEKNKPVQGVEGLFTAIHVALKRSFLGVNSDVNLETVRGEKRLATARHFARERVLSCNETLGQLVLW